jgi:hypothetical protein
MRAATKERMGGLFAKRPPVAGFHDRVVSESGRWLAKTAIFCDAVRGK